MFPWLEVPTSGNTFENHLQHFEHLNPFAPGNFNGACSTLNCDKHRSSGATRKIAKTSVVDVGILVNDIKIQCIETKISRWVTFKMCL